MTLQWRFFSEFFIEVSSHAVFRLGSMNRLHCLPLALVSRMSPLGLPKRPCYCCQYGPAPLQVEQEAPVTEIHSNRFGFLFSHKQRPLHTPSVCVSALVFVTVRDQDAAFSAVFTPGLSDSKSGTETKTGAAIRRRRKKKHWVNSLMCQSAD